MIWPDAIEVISRPPITGSSCRPEAVGERPRTVCWNSGRNVSAPKSAKPTTSATALVTTNTRLRNSAGGRIGSAARRSTNASATMRGHADEPDARRSAAEAQSYVFPPSVVSRMIALSPTASSTVPA